MTLFAFMLYFLHSCCFFGDFISKLIKYQHQELIPMETLATSVTRFFLQKHYIEPDQAEWFQYGLIRRMIGSLTFLLLLPIGAIFVGWIGSFLYLYSFRFLRTRTGG